jgi:hypothetical protein
MAATEQIEGLPPGAVVTPIDTGAIEGLPPGARVTPIQGSAPTPAPDFTANPKGEGLYRMGSYDEHQGVASKPEIQVPFSKVQDAQSAGYNLHPDESARYQKDFNHQGQGPTFSERARNLFMRATAPMPDQPLEFTSNPSVGSAFRSIPAALGNVERLPFNAINRATRDIVALPGQAGQTVANIAQGKPEGLEAVNPATMAEGASKNLTEDAASLGPVAAVGNLGGDLGAAYLTSKVTPGLPAETATDMPKGGIREGMGLRERAMEIPDVAALKAQRIPQGSKFADRALQSTQATRGYTQGVSSVEDMKARVPAAQDEVWAPYKETLDAIGDKAVNGPDGPTTLRALEDERKQLSAMNRGLKTGDPKALKLAEQKGMTEADALAREESIKNALDPHLEQAGINPKLIRQTWGQLADIGDRFAGQNTLTLPDSPSGFGKMVDINLKSPRTWAGKPLQGARDLIAGRPAWSAKARDIAVKEGFRTGGPKPDLGKFNPESQASPVAPENRQLPAPSRIIDAEFTPGTTEGRTLPPEPPKTPSIITPAPDQPKQLPAQAGPEGVPQGPPPSTAPPPAAVAVERTRAPLPTNPQPTPPGRTTVTPEGTAIPERKLLTAPKSGKTVNVGDTVTVKGVKGKVTGMNDKTGKIEIEWTKK